LSSVSNPSGRSRGTRIAAGSGVYAPPAGESAPGAGEASGQERVRPSGFVFKLEKARGPSWWAKYRLPDGTQVNRKVGPAWTGRGRPAAGYFTKRLAEDWLHDTFEHVIAPTANMTGLDEFVVVGCQTILCSLEQPPESMLQSLEVEHLPAA
jgi:hypothetical protein